MNPVGSGVTARTLAAIPTLDEIAARPESVRDLPRHALVDLALRCATAQSAIAAALAVDVVALPAGREPDQLLTAREAARLLSRTPDWLYRHADELPFTIRETGHRPRFSARGIQRYISRHAGGQAARGGG
jgi:hypothetical protein